MMYVHMLSMGMYLFGLGYEFMARLLGGPTPNAAALGPRLASAVKVQHIAMVPLFLTGGYLIQAVPKDRQPGFVVTLLVFLALAGLTGAAGARYRKEPSLAPTLASMRFLWMRVALVGFILFHVSTKPSMAITALAFIPFPILGEVIARSYKVKPSPSLATE